MRLSLIAASLFLCACAAVAPAVPAHDDAAVAGPFADNFPEWYRPAAPYRIIGNIYAVGPEGIGVFFIPTTQGHILIDGGLPENAPMIARNIETLGYRVQDVRILLNSHAHFDHSGGLAALKELSGAELWASEGDRSALEGGFYLGWEDRHEFDTPPVKVDRLVRDGDRVSLGGVTLRAALTPGHTRGCTSWWMTAEQGGTSYETLFFCSASVAANRLSGPPQYEGIVADYRSTFERMRGWRPDVFLANHPAVAGMGEKRAAQQAGDPLAFVERSGFPAFTEAAAADFEKKLAAAEAATD